MGRPGRMRATYYRFHGAEHFLASLGWHAAALGGVLRRGKRIREVPEALTRLRRCYPRRCLCVILDNPPQFCDHPRFLAHLHRLRIYACLHPDLRAWLNLIEAQFGVLRRRTLTIPTIRA